MQGLSDTCTVLLVDERSLLPGSALDHFTHHPVPTPCLWGTWGHRVQTLGEKICHVFPAFHGMQLFVKSKCIPRLNTMFIITCCGLCQVLSEEIRSKDKKCCDGSEGTEASGGEETLWKRPWPAGGT